MNSVTEVFTDNEQFFAPAANDMIDGLMASYRASRQKIERISEFVTDEMLECVDYFFKGNSIEMRYHTVAQAFKVEGAVKALNAHYWGRALQMTDVLQVMPQKRRDEWGELIRKQDTPEFEENSVRATIDDLLASRHKFFAEKVDGIFRSLSHEHVTNCPQGFNKRMILGGVTDGHYYISGTQCTHNSETTVACHISGIRFVHGTGNKVDDMLVADGCSSCHDVVDGRVKVTHLSWEDVRIAHYEGVFETLLRRKAAGLI